MNKAIDSARETALSLLQPSQRDLEHGLELHRESLVIESYGFTPRASVDYQTLEETARAGASAAEIQNLYEQMSMTAMTNNLADRSGYATAFEAAGVDCVFQNAGEENNDIEVLLRRLGCFTYAVDMMPDVLRRAATPDDILAAKRDGKRCLYLTTNGVPVPKYFHNDAEGVSQIRTLFHLGVRMMHLTYNRRNLIGDGCGEPSDGGLSEFGRAVVKEMNRVGVIVDISHSGVHTGLEAAHCSDKPVAISHAVCGGLSDHCRAKPDELIRAVAETGGTMGICCIPAFLGGSGDIRAFLDHIDHAVQLVGAAHVTIGTDVGARCQPDQSSSPDIDLPRSRPRFQALWPKNDALSNEQWQTPAMVESMRWTNWPLFTVGLVQRGHSDDDIQKIIGGNILRVAKQQFNQTSQ